MGIRENKVEKYLSDEIYDKFNTITRKWVSPGHDGVMDQICFLNPEWYVEVKTKDGIQKFHQAREANRLITFGARVAIVYGHIGVDKFIKWLKDNRYQQPSIQVVFK